jgi:hypothetical protein
MKASRVIGGSLMLAGMAAASLGISGVAGAASSPQRSLQASSSPPGNNGTIKIDDVPLVNIGLPDDHANHPHVSCTLALSFFGFDATTNDATVSFAAQPPSGTGPVAATEGPTAFTFKGYGPGDTLDYSADYQLDVSGLKANPNQGYHIKVTVDVSNPATISAADEKYKVFWYQPCGAAPTTTTSPSSTTTTTTPKIGVGVGTTTTVPSTTTTLPLATTTTTTPKVAAGVGTTTTTAPPVATSRPPQSGAPGSQVALGAGSSGAPESLPSSAASSQVPASSQFPASSQVLGSSAQFPASSQVLGSSSQVPAASAAGQLPTGAGTDLGFFKPASWARSAGPSWDLLIAGGVIMLLTGGLIRRRK